MPARKTGVTSNLYSVAEAQFDPDVRRLCREACRRLPDVQCAENEGQGEGSLDLSIHDPVFLRAIDALAVPGLLIGHRVISQGDESAAPRGDGVVVLFCDREASRQWRRTACGAPSGLVLISVQSRDSQLLPLEVFHSKEELIL